MSNDVSTPVSIRRCAPAQHGSPPTYPRAQHGRPVEASVLDLVCLEAGARRSVVVDRLGRIDVLEVPHAEVRW